MGLPKANRFRQAKGDERFPFASAFGRDDIPPLLRLRDEEGWVALRLDLTLARLSHKQ